MKGLSRLTCKERWESWDCSAREEKAWRGISSFIVHKYLEGRCEEDRDRLFSEVPSGRTRGSGHKLKYRRSPLNIRKHSFTVRITKHWLEVPSEIVEFPSLDIVKNHLDMVPCHWLYVAVLARGKLDQVTPRGHFQARSVILWCCMEYNPFIRKSQDTIFFW